MNTRSLLFDSASSEYVTFPTNAAYAPANYTVEWWAKIPSAGGGSVLGKDKSGSRQFLFSCTLTAIAWEHAGGNGGNADTAISISADQWHHFAITNNAGNHKYYLDGALVEDESAPGGYAALTNETGVALRMGAREFGGAEGYFKGNLDDVRMWNTVRTQAEIQANMARELVGNETGLIFYTKLNDGSGTTATDSSATANNGTLVNTPAWSTDIPFTDSGGLFFGS